MPTPVPINVAQFTPSEPQRFIQIDEDGYFKMDDLRVADAETGRAWLAALNYDPHFSHVWTHMDQHDVLVEAFDAPFVVLTISHDEPRAAWTAQMPYGHSENFKLDSLTLDEWDRFHGRTERGIPFVFSRSAQASFFNLLDDYDDDSIESGARTYKMKPWLSLMDDADQNARWSERYRTGDTPWDLKGPHPSLSRVIATLKLQRSRILVLGCGHGHDAAWFARAGHIVTAIDFSEEAIARAKAEYAGVPDLTFLQADALNLSTKFDQSFDIVFEHTLYCAIDPARRSDLEKSWLRALTDHGHVCGFFFASEKRNGPPFGGSEWELRSRFAKRFRTLYWQRVKDSNASRLGSELFLYLQKLPTLR